MFKRKDVIATLWMTFLTVVAWIGFSIYHIWITSTISAIDVSTISPISPDFDTNVINTLKSRETITPLYNFTGKVAPETASLAAKTLPPPTETTPQLSGAP